MIVIILLLEISSAKYFAYPIVRTWTYYELSKTLDREDPLIRTIESEKVTLLHALGQMVSALFTGNPDYAIAILLSPTGRKEWTKEELEVALMDDKTDVYITPFLGHAYVALNVNNKNGRISQRVKLYVTEVKVIALDVSTWTKQDINKALSDRSINPDLVRYMQEAQQEFIYMEAENKKKGNYEPVQNVTILTPVGLIPPPVGVVPQIVPRNTMDTR